MCCHERHLTPMLHKFDVVVGGHHPNLGPVIGDEGFCRPTNLEGGNLVEVILEVIFRVESGRIKFHFPDAASQNDPDRGLTAIASVGIGVLG